MKAVVLAGGKGTRLRPYTTVFPKPLMPLGEKPVLDIVIRQLKAAGVTEVTLAVGHLASLIQAYFGDGSQYGIKIAYSLEEKPLGTAGPIRLVKCLDDRFLVMNGDILTSLDYGDLVRHHVAHGAACTVATYKRDVKIDLGVVEFGNDFLLSDYIEKPTYHYRVSMGIYVFEPWVLKHIPENERLDLPDLMLKLHRGGEKIVCYPHEGYWLDIGRPDDYEKAAADFEALEAKLLPGS